MTKMIVEWEAKSVFISNNLQSVQNAYRSNFESLVKTHLGNWTKGIYVYRQGLPYFG